MRSVAYRAAMALPIMLAVSVIVFVVLRLLPADPVAMSMPPGATAEEFARMRAELGLDQPVIAQYAVWLARSVVGDFGQSIFFRRPVRQMIGIALPATIELVVAGLATGTAMGVAGGLILFAAGRGVLGTALDAVVTAVMSIPEFLWGIILILGLGVMAPVLPFIGRLDPSIPLPPSRTGFLLLDSLLSGRMDAFGSALLHLLLPALALGIGLAPLVARVLRSSLLGAALEDHVVQARRRGLTNSRLLLRHILPNAALPTVALLGVQGGFMFGGTVLIESIFAFPGLGALVVDAVRNHDLPLIQGVALTYCVLVLILNGAIDALYVSLDPRLAAA